MSLENRTSRRIPRKFIVQLKQRYGCSSKAHTFSWNWLVITSRKRELGKQQISLRVVGAFCQTTIDFVNILVLLLACLLTGDSIGFSDYFRFK